MFYLPKTVLWENRRCSIFRNRIISLWQTATCGMSRVIASCKRHPTRITTQSRQPLRVVARCAERDDRAQAEHGKDAWDRGGRGGYASQVQRVEEALAGIRPSWDGASSTQQWEDICRVCRETAVAVCSVLRHVKGAPDAETSVAKQQDGEARQRGRGKIAHCRSILCSMHSQTHTLSHQRKIAYGHAARKSHHQRPPRGATGQRDSKGSFVPDRGLREGCPSSPILFNVYHRCVMEVFRQRRQRAGDAAGLAVEGRHVKQVRI